jgi:hypothetical protein
MLWLAHLALAALLGLNWSDKTSYPPAVPGGRPVV